MRSEAVGSTELLGNYLSHRKVFYPSLWLGHVAALYRDNRNPCLKYRAFLASVPGYMDEVVEFHFGIVKAIEKKDANRAESLRRAISENGRRLIHHYFIGQSSKDRKRQVRA